MKPKYMLALVAQSAAYGFIAVWVLVLFGAANWIPFAAIGALALFGGITPLFLNCEQCGVTYFWSERAAEKPKGGMNLRPGYNLLLPLRGNCPNCGFNRRD